ncbi:MAG: GtrA family protein [Oligoflexia bacterium]|nr:GtrA family protein [Oligoflexia bacterium]
MKFSKKINLQLALINPLIVFAKFSLVSLITSITDYLCFIAIYYACSNLLLSLIVARIIAIGINYLGNKFFSFKNNKQAYETLPLFVTLCILQLLATYGLILLLDHYLSTNIYIARLISDGALFILSFIVQKKFIFKS